MLYGCESCICTCSRAQSSRTQREMYVRDDPSPCCMNNRNVNMLDLLALPTSTKVFKLTLNNSIEIFSGLFVNCTRMLNVNVL